MRRILQFTLLTFITLCSLPGFGQFTTGNLVVLQAEASANNTTCSIVEINKNASGQSALTTTIINGTGVNAFRISGSATSTGYLSHSNDRSLVVFNGANSETTSSNVNTLNPRGVATLNADQIFTIQTTYTGISGNQTRSATSLNNTDWFIADQGGIYTNNATAASPTGNFRSIKPFGGIVYVAQASSTVTTIQVSTVSAATGGTITGLPGLINNASIQDFYLIASGNNGDTFDVLYVLSATSNTAGNISKYALVNGTWTANGSYVTNFGGFSLAAERTGNEANLYVTTGQGALTANSVIKLTDASGFNADINITTANNVSLYTAPSGKIVKGINFTPVKQTQPGDLAFVGLNAENNDDYSLVALHTIPENSTFYFRDDEWNGSALGAGGAFIDAAESSFQWNTGSTAIEAGTVISFNNIGNSTLATVSVGLITYINTANTGVGGNDEAIFVYRGTDVNTPTSFITAFGKGVNAFGTAGLNGTGLTEGATAVYFSAGIDIAAYNGQRTGLMVNDFQTAINNSINWITEDGSGDQYNNSIQPDTPFSTTAFTFSAGDVTPPSVISVAITSLTTIDVTYSESVTNASATALANYTLTQGATVTNITYNNTTRKATLTVSTLSYGLSYTLTINGIEDGSGNSITTAFVSPVLIFNNATPSLVITEIMYNALNIPQADALEFIEIHNTSNDVIQAGGLRIKDANNFDFSLPETTIPANGFLLLATDKAGAEAFYIGKTFLDLPVTGNVLSNGGELIQLLNSLGTIIDEVNYDDVAPWPTDADEKGFSLELYRADLDNNVGSNWGLPSQSVGTLSGTTIFATPGNFSAALPPISFLTETTTTTENAAGAININLRIAFSDPANSSTVEVMVTSGTAILNQDYTFTSPVATFPANNSANQSISINILDNTNATQDKYLVLEIKNPGNASLGAIKRHVIFIKDNDRTAINPSNALNLNFTSNFKVPETGSSAEISAYDPDSKRLFVVNSLLNKLEILNFANPEVITRITSVSMAPYGAGINSVAVKNGIVAVALENTNETNGKVAFFTTEGVHQVSIDAGNLPDMVTFSPDGKYVLTANEGQPIFYTPTLNDPEGSITIIDISGGISNLTQANATQVNFNAFDSQMASLKTAGVRIFGPGSSVSQDLEPEFITVSADSKKAWVTLQENNAVAFIDLTTKTITDIKPLGLKDYSMPENTFDASDVSGEPFFGTWKIKGMYMPDAIASFEVAGIPYLITANEGDAREYTGITDEVSFASLNLDATAFPDAAVLKNNSLLGRLLVTNKNGDTDGDGDYDEVYAYGARSFTIWNGVTGAKVFDSGNQIERITAEDPVWGAFFNANNSTGAPVRKNRSDNKGPEPEGVVVATINGKQYAFIGLERIGGVLTYDVTNPSAPIFVGYDNNRSLVPAPTDDLGTEGIIYISPKESPNGNALVILANEISGTISVYTIEGVQFIDKPTAIAATAISTSSFTANWNAVTDATSYQLDVSTDNFLTFVEGFNNKTINGTTAVINNLVSATAYQYRVRALKNINISENSNTIIATTNAVPAPVATAPTGITGISFTANWNAVTDATGYRIDVSENGFNTYVQGFENKSVTGTSANITGLADGKAYSYRIRAEIGTNVSVNSNTIEVVITSVTPEKQIGYKVFPNPAHNEINFSKPIDFVLLTNTGVVVKQGKNTSTVFVGDLEEGIYLLKDVKGNVSKISIKR